MSRVVNTKGTKWYFVDFFVSFCSGVELFNLLLNLYCYYSCFGGRGKEGEKKRNPLFGFISCLGGI